MSEDHSDAVPDSLVHFRLLLENAGDVVMLIDVEGLVTWFMDASHILGYDTDELVGSKIDDVLSPDSALVRQRHRTSAATSPVERFVLDLRDKRGAYHSFSAVRRPLVGDRGELRNVVLSLHLRATDPSSEKDDSVAKDHYKFLATFARDVVVIERGGVVDWVSSNAEQMIGISTSDLEGRAMLDFVHPDDRASLSHLSSTNLEDDVAALTLRVLKSDGTYRWVNGVVRELEDAVTNEKLRLSSWRDAQGDVIARQALLTSERRYRLLAENSTDVVVECDVDGVVRWLSPSALSSLGWRIDDLVGQRLLDRVVDADQLRAAHQIEEATATHQAVPVEVRYLTSEGVAKCMSQQVRRFRGHEDSRYVFIVTLHDLEEYVTMRSNFKIVARELELLSANSTDIVYTVNLEGVVTWVSTSMTVQLGWQTGAIVGSDISGLVFEDDRPRILAWRQLVHFGEVLENLEVRVRHALGYLVWMKVQAHPERSEDGRVIGVVSSWRNCDAEVASSRALRTISAGSRILMREMEPRELLRKICQVAVDEGGYAFAWFGRKMNDDEKSVRVVASSAGHESYLEEIRVTWNLDEGGQGPTGRAIRLGESITVKDAYSDPAFQPWRRRAQAHGFHSACAIPVIVDGQIEGAWQVYAREQNAFTPNVLTVLEDLALETGIALSRLDSRAF